jgi:hypothetical protein
LTCITGSVAEAFYKEIPGPLVDFIKKKIPGDMKQVIERFRASPICRDIGLSRHNSQLRNFLHNTA